MARVNRLRYIEFRLSDLNGNPVNGQTLGTLAVTFTRNSIACSDVLTLTNPSSGFYILTYTPTAAGHDYIEIFYAPGGIRFIDAEEVDSTATFFDLSETVNLTQDYGGTGRLKLSAPDAQTYTLLIFRSSDWQSGRTQPTNAIASTMLDSKGNWITSPVPVLKATYHVVAINSQGLVQVLFPFLQVL